MKASLSIALILSATLLTACGGGSGGSGGSFVRVLFCLFLLQVFIESQKNSSQVVWLVDSTSFVD